jgi:hypothetical protein
LLQEVIDSPEMLTFWNQHFPHIQWEFSRSFKMMNSFFHTGVGIGYRSKPNWVEYLKTKDRELFVFTPKSSIVAEMNYEGENFLVVCTHC